MHNEFITACKHQLGDHIALSPADAESYTIELADIGNRPSHVLKPASQDEAMSIVHLANKYKAPLYPISQGKNWGLGSRTPCRDMDIVLDLSGLNRIISHSEEYGHIVIEPGVTQRQIHDFLKEQNSQFFLDITGSGADTSIVGNALERGTAYNTLRAENVHSFTIIAGNGRRIQTGQANSSLEGILHHTTGPELTDLFIQSNFGIIVQATVNLIQRPECAQAFTISIPDESRLSKCIQIVRQLMRSNELMGVPHIFDKERMHSALAPLLHREMLKDKLTPSKDEVHDIIQANIPGTWWIVGSLQGSKGTVAAKVKALKTAFKDIAAVQAHSPNQLMILSPLLKLLRKHDILRIMRASRVMSNMPTGVPTNDTLFSTVWPFSESMNYDDSIDVDASPTGYRFVVPGIPLDTKSVERIIALFNQYRKEDKVRFASSINPMNANVGEGVISFSYPRTPESTRKVAQLEKRFRKQLIDEGFGLMRLGIHQMDEMSIQNAETIHELKKIFDPNGIIAPARYVPPLR